MEGYKISVGQKKSIEKKPISKNHIFNPVQDINGDWFIFEEEMKNIITNPEWRNIQKTEYAPPVYDNEVTNLNNGKNGRVKSKAKDSSK